MRILCHFFVHLMDDLVHLLGLDMLVKNVLNQDQDTNVLEIAAMSIAVRASVLPQQDSQDQVVKHEICPDPPVVSDIPLADQVRLV
jgi:hypothetical protein